MTNVYCTFRTVRYIINTADILECERKYHKQYFHSCSQEVQHNCQLHRISFCADDKTDKRIFTFICKDSESNKHLCFVFDSEKCVSMPDVLGRFVLFYKPWIVLFPALTKYLEMNKVCKHLTAVIDSSCHENRLQDSSKLNLLFISKYLHANFFY